MSRPGSSKRRHKSKSHKEIYRRKGGSERMSFEKAHKGCMDKTTFHSRKTVRSAAKKLGFRYYKCPFCGEFHLTKSKGAMNPWRS